jgi:hypothetical protein
LNANNVLATLLRLAPDVYRDAIGGCQCYYRSGALVCKPDQEIGRQAILIDEVELQNFRGVEQALSER